MVWKTSKCITTWNMELLHFVKSEIFKAYFSTKFSVNFHFFEVFKLIQKGNKTYSSMWRWYSFDENVKIPCVKLWYCVKNIPISSGCFERSRSSKQYMHAYVFDNAEPLRVTSMLTKYCFDIGERVIFKVFRGYCRLKSRLLIGNF